MLELTNDISKECNFGKNVDSECIHLAKAFDIVLHKQLIYKLSQYGIAKFILQWIADFLYRRKTFVHMNDYTSKTHNFTSSVPQGSVLTPRFFFAVHK